jgi:hypothetical protein
MAAAGMTVAALFAIVLGILLSSRSGGTLLATVAGPGNVPVDSLKLYVDGKLVCESSPCRIDELPRGTHFVRVVAEGYQRTADRAIAVVSGEESVLNVALSREELPKVEAAPVTEVAAAQATPREAAAGDVSADDKLAQQQERSAPRSRTRVARANTPAPRAAALPPRPVASDAKGILMISASSPANVVVDGRPLGKTPQTLRVSAGRHTVVFVGEKGRRVQAVEVAPGERKALAAKF